MGNSKTEFDVFCPECNMLIAAKVIAVGNGNLESENPFDVVDSLYHCKQYYVCLCGRCNQPFLIQQSLQGVPGEFEGITDEKILHPNYAKLPLKDIPTVIKSSYDQATRSFLCSLFEPCVLMCRKCLEAICKTFNADGRDLNSKLKSLNDTGKIDSRLLVWAHQIRLLGNDAAHDPNIIITKLDARDCLDFTESILFYIFSLSLRFEAFNTRRINTKTKA